MESTAVLFGRGQPAARLGAGEHLGPAGPARKTPGRSRTISRRRPRLRQQGSPQRSGGRTGPGALFPSRPQLLQRPADFRPDFGSATVHAVAGGQGERKVRQRRDGSGRTPQAPASVTVALDSPFLVVRASGVAEGADKVEVSTDGGKGFFAADLKDLRPRSRATVGCEVRVSFKTSLSR